MTLATQVWAQRVSKVEGTLKKLGFREAKAQYSPINGNTRPNCNGKSLAWTLGYMPVKFGDPTYLGLVTAGVQSQGYVSR